MSSCWETGGPEWLFGVELFALFTGFTLLGLACIAWVGPKMHPGGRRESLAVGGFLLAWLVVTVVAGPRAAGELGVLALALIVVGFVARVVLVAAHDRATGVVSSPAQVRSLAIVRWSTTVTAAALLGLGLTAVVVDLALGHSC